MYEDRPTRLWRACAALASLLPVAGFTVAVVAHARFTSAQGSGFEGYELVDGPVYRTGTLLLLTAESCLLLALVSWYARLRSPVPAMTHVRRLIWTATLLALTAAVVVTASTSIGQPVDVAPLGIAVVVLFGAACFLLGRGAASPHPVGWLLQAVPVAVVLVIAARTTALEVPALVVFGLLCLTVTLLLPLAGDDVVTDARRSHASLRA